MTNQRSIDAPSIGQKFGWERIGHDEFAIPVIVRTNNVRYSPARIIEQEIIKKYDVLPSSVFTCITLKSYYLTAAEAKLLNDINFNHCNNRYGESSFTTKDVIISAVDVKHLSRFLNISHAIFTNDLAKVSDNFGVIKLSRNPGNSNDVLLVPYIAKSYQDKPVRFIPSSLVDSFVAKSRVSVCSASSSWDIMYLKMLCVYCDNNMQQNITPESRLVLLDGLLYRDSGNPIIFENLIARPAPALEGL